MGNVKPSWRQLSSEYGVTDSSACHELGLILSSMYNCVCTKSSQHANGILPKLGNDEMDN